MIKKKKEKILILMEDLNLKKFFSFFFCIWPVFTFLNKVKLKFLNFCWDIQVLSSDWLIIGSNTLQLSRSVVPCLCSNLAPSPYEAIMSYQSYTEVYWICLYNRLHILSSYVSPSTLFLHRATGNQPLSSSHSTLCQTLWRISGD